MATLVDLQGPLTEFYERTSHIRQTLAAVEAIAAGEPVHSSRQRADLDQLNLATSNTASSMALIFLASSFEEYFRQEMTQCGDYFSVCYADIDESLKLHSRNSYWNVFLDRVRYVKSVTKVEDRVRYIDSDSISLARTLLDSARRFSLHGDSAAFDGKLIASHSNNFRPSVLKEIGNRLGISDILGQAAESSRVKNYFAEPKRVDASEKLKSKLDQFYGIRNQIVHSLNSTSGYGVDFVYDYIELFECLAEGIRAALARHIAAWKSP